MSQQITVTTDASTPLKPLIESAVRTLLSEADRIMLRRAQAMDHMSRDNLGYIDLRFRSWHNQPEIRRR